MYLMYSHVMLFIHIFYISFVISKILGTFLLQTFSFFLIYCVVNLIVYAYGVHKRSLHVTMYNVQYNQQTRRDPILRVLFSRRQQRPFAACFLATNGFQERGHVLQCGEIGHNPFKYVPYIHRIEVNNLVKLVIKIIWTKHVQKRSTKSGAGGGQL